MYEFVYNVATKRPKVNFVLYVARRLLERISCGKVKHQTTSGIFIHRPLKRKGLKTQMNSETEKKRTTLKPSQAQPRFHSKSEEVSKMTGRSTAQNDSQFYRNFRPFLCLQVKLDKED